MIDSPRLMTLNEVIEGPQDLFVERSFTSVFDTFVTAATRMWVNDKVVRFYGFSGLFDRYGKREGWRCWTSRPSDKQMKEAKWDG